jgi:signal transduction histidine kinase
MEDRRWPSGTMRREHAACEDELVNTPTIADRWDAAVTALTRATTQPPLLSRWGWTADAVLALVLAVGALDGALSRHGGTETVTPPSLPQTPSGVPVPPAPPVGVITHDYGTALPWQLVLAVLATLPLLARRRYPLTTFWILIGASELYHLSPGFDATFTFAACVVGAYSAVMYSRYQVLATISALAGVGLLVTTHEENVPSIGSGPLTFFFLILIPAALVANTIYMWQQRMRTAEADREAAARLAVDHERARIARELHDVVTHSISVMVVQAGAARKVMATAPAKACDALLAVEAGGRTAMTELRHTMGLLTMNDQDLDPAALPDGEDLTPAPGIGQLDALADRVRATGVPVELAMTGRPVPLSAGMDLAVYRVVQEALTNIMKHAVGAQAQIAIDYGPITVQVEVTSMGGSRAPSARTGTGRGLIGLQERVAVYGGTFEAGFLPSGAYRVRAVIPTEAP